MGLLLLLLLLFLWFKILEFRLLSKLQDVGKESQNQNLLEAKIIKMVVDQKH